MSIHHRSQGGINRRRVAIEDRKRGGVFSAWLRKIRRVDQPARAAPPAAPPLLLILDLRPAEFLGLLVFWALIFAWW